MFSFQRFFVAGIFVLLICTSRSTNQNSSQEETKKPGQKDSIESQILEQQRQRRDSVQVPTDHSQFFGFYGEKVTDFRVYASQTSPLKGEINIYWREDNIFTNSRYLKGEEIELNIIDHSTGKKVQTSKFYMLHGFQYTPIKKGSYILRFQNRGQKPNLIVLNLMRFSEEPQNQEEAKSLVGRSQSVSQAMKSIRTLSEQNMVMHENNSKIVLVTTQKYLNFLLIETGLVLLIAAAEIYFLRKLLSNQSSVI